MKKTVVFLAVAAALLYAGNTYAQRLTINLGYAPQTTTTATTILGSTSTQTDDMTGFFAGVDYNIPLTNYFGLAIGAQARYNYKTTSNDIATTKHTQMLIDVPVLLNFGIRLGADARLSVFAGPVASYALSGNTNVTEKILNTTHDYPWYKEGSKTQQFDVMGAAGVAFDYKLLRLFGGYRMGFLDLDKNDNIKSTTSGIFLGLGYIL